MEKGIYEELVSRSLEKRIEKEEKLKVSFRKLDEGTSSALISKYIEDAVKRILDDKDLEGQISFANSLLETLNRENPEYDVDQLSKKEQGKALWEVRDEKTETKEYQRPVSLTSSRLFSGDADFPYVNELKKEIASSDRIDMLISFIRKSGIALLRPELEEFSRRGGKLRLICTTYMGATQPYAVDEMAMRSGTEVKISYDTEHTRLHAKEIGRAHV